MGLGNIVEVQGGYGTLLGVEGSGHPECTEDMTAKV